VKNLEELIKELPPDLHREVIDFVEFLLAKHRPQSGKKLRQDWAGALKDYREQFTSLELEKKGWE